MDTDKLWRFILFHAEQRYQQYRHLDNIRERYVTLWLGICTVLIGGTLASLSGAIRSINQLYFGLAYLIAGLLGEAVCLMAIQIRSTQIREAFYNIHLRKKVLEYWGKGSNKESKLARLLAWSELATNPRVLNYHSSTVVLILFIGVFASFLLIAAAHFSRTLDFSTLWARTFGGLIIVIQIAAILLYLYYLDKRLESVSTEMSRQIETNECDSDAFVEIASRAQDTN